MPTLIADANPIDKGSMKKRPAKLIAIVCAANAVAPKKEIINAAPLNKLNSTKIPKLIGAPILSSSLKAVMSGVSNLS